MGLTFFGVGAGVDQKAANDLRGVLFFMSIQQSMAGLLAIITLFHGWDRIVFKREHAGSLYSTELYMTSKLMAELPMQILSPILFSAITYWMVGLSPTLNQFLIFVACMVVTTLTGQSLGMVISVFTPTPEMAHVIAPVVIGLLLLSGGFFTSVETVPSWLKWTVQGNFVRYSNESKCDAIFYYSFRLFLLQLLP